MYANIDTMSSLVYFGAPTSDTSHSQLVLLAHIGTSACVISIPSAHPPSSVPWQHLAASNSRCSPCQDERMDNDFMSLSDLDEIAGRALRRLTRGKHLSRVAIT